MDLPRLIATDLDGTFLSPDATVSAINRRAVARAHGAGIPVVFATGRPPTWLGVVADVTGADPLVIASNGAVVLDARTREVVADWPLDATVAYDVAIALREVMPGIYFGVQQHFAFGREEGYEEDVPAEIASTVFAGRLEEMIGAGGFTKLLARHPGLSASEMARRARDVVGDRLTATFSVAEDVGLLELSAPGVTKAHTLALLAAERGIAAGDVAAFGDMPNDREMLRWAGRPHVMGDAHAALADLGATRIGTNATSAVGRTILTWFGEDVGRADALPAG